MLFLKNAFKKMLFSESWPEAVSFICDSESKKRARAAQIFENFIGDVAGKKVLDFGCGEGHLVSFVGNMTFAVGYDVVDPGRERCFCSWEKIQRFSPYDIVILHDVIDHATNEETALDILYRVASVLNDDGVVLVRCHPFCSRSGSHQYHWLNKAYLHLVFTDDELRKFGVPQTHGLKVLRPQTFYGKLFIQANLAVLDRVVEYCFVEKFFEETEEVRNRILRNWSDIEGFPYHQMEQHHVFYKLKASTF